MLPLLLAAAGFAAGWWMDAGLGQAPPGAENRRKNGPAAGAPGESKSAVLTRDNATSPDGLRKKDDSATPARSLDEFIALCSGGNWIASRARIERSLNRLTPAEFTALIEELKMRTPCENDLKGVPQYLITALWQRWQALEPGPALQFGAAFSRRWDSSTFPGGLDAFEKWFKSDAAGATALVAKHRWNDYIDIRLRYVDSLEGMAPEEALRRIAEFDAQTGNDYYSADYLAKFPEEWIRKDPATAMNWALALPPGHTRGQVLGEMRTAWSKLDAPAASQFWDAVPPQVKQAGFRVQREMQEAIEQKAHH